MSSKTVAVTVALALFCALTAHAYVVKDKAFGKNFYLKTKVLRANVDNEDEKPEYFDAFVGGAYIGTPSAVTAVQNPYECAYACNEVYEGCTAWSMIYSGYLCFIYAYVPEIVSGATTVRGMLSEPK